MRNPPSYVLGGFSEGGLKSVGLSHINTIAQILGGGVKKFFKIEHQGADRALRLGLYPFFVGHATHHDSNFI